QYEGRRYRGLLRHLVLSAVSHLFRSRMREELRGEKSGGDGVPGARGDRGVDPELVFGRVPARGVDRADSGHPPTEAAAKRGVTDEPHEANATATPQPRHQTDRVETLPVGTDLAL